MYKLKGFHIHVHPLLQSCIYPSQGIFCFVSSGHEPRTLEEWIVLSHNAAKIQLREDKEEAHLNWNFQEGGADAFLRHHFPSDGIFFLVPLSSFCQVPSPLKLFWIHLGPHPSHSQLCDGIQLLSFQPFFLAGDNDPWHMTITDVMIYLKSSHMFCLDSSINYLLCT